MKALYLIICIGILSLPMHAQPPVVRFDQVLTGLTSPVDVVNAGDGSGRLFVAQRGGQIRIVANGMLLATPLIDISTQIVAGGEQGLLSLAFHPQYASNRYFFVWYTTPTGNLELARFRTSETNANIADLGSKKIIITIDHPGQTNHNGAKINFGTDGFLYVAPGDGGGSNDPSNNAQNGNSLLGKMLRIDVNDFDDNTAPFYNIPASNPYTALNDNIRDEIIALGLRNPWRWCFDKQTGDMWIADVGQSAREEVNFRAAADILTPTNYGWRCREGEIQNPASGVGCPAPANNVEPVYTYQRNNATGGFSITGGAVYRGTTYPALQGWYICVDFISSNIFLIQRAGNTFNGYLQTVNRIGSLSGFGEDETGEVFAVALNTGILYRLRPEISLSLSIIQFTGRALASKHELFWKLSELAPGTQFVVEHRLQNSDPFMPVAGNIFPIVNNAQQFRFAVTPSFQQAVHYRLKAITPGGKIYYSSEIVLGKNNAQRRQPFVSNGWLQVQVLAEDTRIDLLTTTGVRLYQQTLNGSSGVVQINVSHYATGVLVAVIHNRTGSDTYKLLR